MNHLRESINDLLRSNFLCLITPIKLERGNNRITGRLIFHTVSYPLSLPKIENTVSYKHLFVKFKFLFPLKSRYLIV